ncbi:hypothetical protein REPUB_Repub16aG0047400 [Reevesia pubescens]
MSKALPLKTIFLLGLEIYSEKRQANSLGVLFECDNLEGVRWIKDPATAPWRLKRHLNDIELLTEDW